MAEVFRKLIANEGDEDRSGGPLGRHIEHDPRSKDFAFQATGPEGAYQTVIHKRHVAPFDQGNLGSCTANGALGAMATDPFYASSFLSKLNEAHCVTLYEYETRIDGFPGVYPPTDTGSSGLAAAKALKHFGFISGYTHALSLDTAIKATMQRPTITGVKWYSSFDQPDADGQIRVKNGAYVRGGHEFEVFGIDAARERAWCFQSWGPHWGPLGNGRFYMSFATWGKLLADQGDVTVFVPLSG